MTKFPLVIAVTCISTISIAPAQIEPGAGAWKTWLPPVQEISIPRPAGADIDEINWLKDLRKQTNVLAMQQVRYWDAGSPSYRWVELLGVRIAERGINTPNGTRAMALLNVAIYDAMIAAWDIKYRQNRPRPSRVDPSLTPLVSVPDSPSYPSEHAVAAGAAAAILGYLFPSDAGYFQELANEASRTRLFAGVQYPTDVTDGLELGRRAAAAVIDRARSDGSNSVWTGTVPAGPGLWRGTNPASPTTGSWKTYALRAGDEFRPGPPFSYDSPQKAAELAELRGISRQFADQAKAFFYQTSEGIIASWYDLAHRAIFEDHLEQNAPRAARAYALMAVAHYDATVAVWDAKFTYWAPRPFMLDANLITLFATPNHPSFPAAHSTNSTAISAILAYLFPSRAAFYNNLGQEAGVSRMTAGIHFRSDHEIGSQLGKNVADKVIAWAERDGSQ